MVLILRHPAGNSRSLASFTALFLLALLMGACETTGLSGLSTSGEQRAERLARDGRHSDAAGRYIGMAADAAGSERDRLTLLAVEQWLDAGDVSRAQRAQRSILEPESKAVRTIWNTNAAALSLYKGDADDALMVLEPMSRRPLNLRDRLRVEALRADAWIQKQQPARAVELMKQRESWLDSQRAVELNRQRLWQGLLVSNSVVLREAAEAAGNAEIRGWLTLAALATATGEQGVGWNNGVIRWREMNSGHPAFTVIGEADSMQREMLTYPRQIALLLPLTGQSAAAGKAIQNGFLGAYFATASALDDRQALRVYDVNSSGGASAAYQNAVADGAEFVVGPLLKKSVADLANNMLVPVPVLTLNFLPQDTLAPPGLYQFALAPEDEAVSAAIRAFGDGHTRAVALVPDNQWGRRILNSFTMEFEGMGGTLLAHRKYSTDKQDFSNEIESLMGLTGSALRYRRLRANIGESLQFDPRRRQDAQLIFLGAAAGPGRLLKSQLKFHYSGDLPTYATSSVNALDGRSNSDLNGIMFADAPWLINPQPWISYLPQTYTDLWPEERRLGRLHAMGFDAYNLIASLYADRNGHMTELDGASGGLFLDQQGRIHRRLAWAQFQGGEAVALPAQDEVGGPIRDLSDAAGAPIEPDAADDAPWGS